MTLERCVQRWEAFWFRDIPPHLYAAIRIAVGVLGAIGILAMTPVSMFWAIDGLAPVPGDGLGLRAAVDAWGLGDVIGWMLFAGLLSSFVAMTLGWQSRLSVWVCFLGSVVQALWNSLPLSAAHQLLIAILFCLLWLDPGAVWSLDRWADARGGVTRPRTEPIWPLRLLRFQIAVIYFSSGLSKLVAPAWRDGLAVHYAASNGRFHRFPWALPSEAEGVMTALTYVTLFWELAFPLMILVRWTRWLALAIGVLLHVGMWLLLELGPFSWLMMASYLAFLDPHAVSRAVATRFPRFAPRETLEVSS